MFYRLSISFLVVGSLASTHWCHSVAGALKETSKDVRACVFGILSRAPNQNPPWKIEGTAFSVTSDGLLVTASHLVKSSTGLYTFFKGKPKQLTILEDEIGMVTTEGKPFKRWDIAVLKIPGATGIPLVRLKEDNCAMGTLIGSVGYLASGGSVVFKGKDIKIPFLTQGVISGSVFLGTDKQTFDYTIFCDLTASGGSSGSPIFLTETGEVIGIILGGKVTSGTRIPLGVTLAQSIHPVLAWLKMMGYR